LRQRVDMHKIPRVIQGHNDHDKSAGKVDGVNAFHDNIRRFPLQQNKS